MREGTAWYIARIERAGSVKGLRRSKKYLGGLPSSLSSTLRILAVASSVATRHRFRLLSLKSYRGYKVNILHGFRGEKCPGCTRGGPQERLRTG